MMLWNEGEAILKGEWTHASDCANSGSIVASTQDKEPEKHSLVQNDVYHYINQAGDLSES